MQASGKTDLFYIIGSPVSHFRSLSIFNDLYAARGHDFLCAALHVQPQDLADALNLIRKVDNIKGACTTIPHKIAAAGLVDTLTEAAQRTGSVNFIRREPDGTLTGHNIDGQGFMAGVTGTGFDPKGAEVVQVGAGGVGRASAFALAGAGVARLTILNRDAAKAESLAQEIRAVTGTETRGLGSASSLDLSGVTLLVNATPLGMGGVGGLPIDMTGLSPQATAADVVISATDTPFVAEARRIGCRVMTGADMLMPQIGLSEEFLYHRSPA